jgi:RNA polymerase sigma-70 factor (ECF subfamily)
LRAESPPLRRALLRDPGDADDLVQDCLERALSRRHLWRGRLGLRPWLFRILQNIHANELRTRRTRPLHRPLNDDLPDGAAAGQDARVELREMETALNLLSEEQRQIVLMVALSGLSYRDCAEALDVPVGTVMSRLSRCRERLRQLLSGETRPALRRVK